LKLLVTGGAGFIGSHVVRLLKERGDDVRVTLAPGESDAPLQGLDVETQVCDIRDLAAVEQAIADCDAVIHLAAVYRVWMRDYRPMYQVNVEGTRNILSACRAAGTDRVVYTSSIAALGVEAGLQPANEDTEFNQHKAGNHYVLSKFYAQRVVDEFAAEGMPVISVHPSFPFGVGDHRPTPTGRSMIRIIEGTYFAHGTGGLNVVDVEDVARGHLLALERGSLGRRYLLSGNDVSMGDLFTAAKRVAGIERKHFEVPMWVLQGMGLAGDVVGWFTEPMMTSRTVAYTSQYLYYDCSRARDELGYTVTPLDQALEKSITWFRQNGYFDRNAKWRLSPLKRSSG